MNLIHRGQNPPLNTNAVWVLNKEIRIFQNGGWKSVSIPMELEDYLSETSRKFIKNKAVYNQYITKKDIIDICNIIDPDYERKALKKEPLTFEILTDGDIKWGVNTTSSSGTSTIRTIKYSINDGEWTSITATLENQTPQLISVHAGDIVKFKATNATYGMYGTMASCFSDSTCKFNVYGNILSLIDEDDFENVNAYVSGGNDEAFPYLFAHTSVVNAKNLILPAFTDYECYYQMFSYASELLTTPKLEATTLGRNCYSAMFDGCSGLTDDNIPELPATTLNEACYCRMFAGCTSLTKTPDLPAAVMQTGCYREMFEGCTSITTASDAISNVTTLAYSCFEGMFKNCTSLRYLPTLSLTSLQGNCYKEMFYGCTSISATPTLPATSLADYCYQGMFQECTSLTTIKELPATSLAPNCYSRMFKDCTGLNYYSFSYGLNHILPATTLRNNCYESMFEGCSNLNDYLELPATTLTYACYKNMFKDCTSLRWTPVLDAPTLYTQCYYQMFSGCSSLAIVDCYATDISASNCTYNWLSGVPGSGIFNKVDSTNWSTSSSGMPSGWSMPNYNNMPLTFEFMSNHGVLWIKTTEGTCSFNWGYTTIASNNSTATTTPTYWDVSSYSSGIKISFKGSYYSPHETTATNICFEATNICRVYGNIMSLNYSDNSYQTATTVYENFYKSFFYTNRGNKIVDARHLKLPATTLADNCYRAMFASTPELRYAPELPAETLAPSCYYHMFMGCSKLKKIVCNATDNSASLCTAEWATGVSPTGTFVKNANMNNWTTGVSGIPSGWTVQDL